MKMTKALLLTLPLILASFSIPAGTGPHTTQFVLTKDYAEIQTALRDLANKYPTNAKLISIGKNDQDIEIEGLEIGNGSVASLVVGTHHGNEYGSTEVARALAADLAQNPIPGLTVYVIPVLNITGFNARTRCEIPKNWNGVSDRSCLHSRGLDPNRDYPSPCREGVPFRLKSTAALAKFIEAKKIVTSATLHTFFPAVCYPWGISTHDLDTPYTEQFKAIGNAATVESKYAVGNSTELLYPADGAFEDYAFWKLGAWSMLFEMGRSHSPSPASVEQLNSVNVPGLRRMLAEAPRQPAENHDFTGKCDAVRSTRVRLE